MTKIHIIFILLESVEYL